MLSYSLVIINKSIYNLELGKEEYKYQDRFISLSWIHSFSTINEYILGFIFIIKIKILITQFCSLFALLPPCLGLVPPAWCIYIHLYIYIIYTHISDAYDNFKSVGYYLWLFM